MDTKNICRHIAIIMDGNGRWAKKRGMPRTFGHKKGAENVVKITRAMKESGVKYLTLYAFSTENWKRSREEVEALMKLFRSYLKKCIKISKKNNMRMKVIGDITAFAPDIQQSVRELEEYSKDFDGIYFQLALNYGSRDEIRRGMQKMAQDVKDGKVEPDSITEEKLKVLASHGISRISINPQTMNQKTLDLIGRRHTVENVKEKFHMARALGFDNINMDLIMGLPGEDLDDVKHTLEEIEALKPDSLTVHSLAIKRAARLNMFKEEYADLKISNTPEMIALSEDCARRMGMEPYYLYRQKNMAGNFENVGYSLLGKACIYNILIMEEMQTIAACGAGTTTKVVFPSENRRERCENVKEVEQYISRIDEMIGRKEKLLGRRE